MKKNLDLEVLFRDFLSNDINVPSKSNKHKKIFFVGILKVTDEKSRIQSGIRILHRDP